jgi:hypothetical protein
VGVQAHQACRDAEVTQQIGGAPRIFSGHQRGLAQHLQRAERNVVEVADRSRHDEQRTGHILL